MPRLGLSRTVLPVIAAAVAASFACAGVAKPIKPSARVPGATLWAEPVDLATRDLYYGPWGRDAAPDPNAVYKLVERNTRVSMWA